MHIIRCGLLVGLISSVLVLTGCVSVQEVYPKFKEQSAQFKTVAITTDVLVLEDVRGTVHLVDVSRDLGLAKSINDGLAREFARREITVVTAEAPSVGLRFATETVPELKVRAAGVAADVEVKALPTKAAPYFLAEGVLDERRRMDLQGIFAQLKQHEIKAGTPNLVSSLVPLYHGDSAATHHVFVLVEGVQIPLSKGLGQALGTGLLTLGTLSVFQVTTVSYRIGIADARTGEFILIADCSIPGGWTVHERYLERQTGMFLALFDRLRK